MLMNVQKKKRGKESDAVRERVRKKNNKEGRAEEKWIYKGRKGMEKGGRESGGNGGYLGCGSSIIFLVKSRLQLQFTCSRKIRDQP